MTRAAGPVRVRNASRGCRRIRRGALNPSREVGLLGSDLSKGQGASKADRGRPLVPEAPVQFTLGSMKQVIRLDLLSIGDAGEGVESGLSALELGDRDGAVQFHNG